MVTGMWEVRMETVTSADGTEIAYERTGAGRALIICLARSAPASNLRSPRRC